MTISRNAARKLSSEASKAGATILGGQLIKEGDRYVINKTDLITLLDALEGQNVLVLVGEVDQETEALKRTCLTCGADYTGSECPRCARVRSRLRR
jgi:hypothetical protein